MSFAEKYGLVFRYPCDGWKKGDIDTSWSHVYTSLRGIRYIHIEECEWLIEEIEEAQAGRDYVDVPNFDWNGVDIELHYPNVEIEGFVIPMGDFKGILMEWVSCNLKFKGN